MKTNYTDTQLQAAIDEACKEVANGPHRPMFAELALIDTEMHAWVNENDARLDLIKSALAALPEPEPPTVDGKTPGQVCHETFNPKIPWENTAYKSQYEVAASAVLAAFGKQSQPAEEANARAEKAEAELARVREACDRMSEQEVLSLSQLRPLAEAGEVPEGCLRFYTYKKDGKWTPATKHRAMQDTHYIDTRLPEPEPLVTKPISLPLAESMTLRDWFAGKALTMLADPDFSASPEDTAKLVYRIADAMLKAREAKP